MNSTRNEDGDGNGEEDCELNNPLRFTISDRSVDVSAYLGASRCVTEIETRPSEGNL